MLKKNRTPDAEEVNPVESKPVAQRVSEPVKKAASKPAPAKRTRKAATARSQAADATKEQVSAYVPATLRNRARAAYKATGHLEGDASFSEFVEAALLAETLRRERLYNDSAEYTGDAKKLAPGRPLS